MSSVERQREDGPLAAAVPHGVVNVPDVAVVAFAALLTLLPALGLLGVPTGPPWPWVLAGVALAVVGRAARPIPRVDWPVPALLRLIEYVGALLLVGATPAVYALLAVVAYRHYDIVYRERTRGDAPPRWLVPATGGWELRTTLLAVASAFGLAEPTALALAAWLACILAAEALTSWRRVTRDQPAILDR